MLAIVCVKVSKVIGYPVSNELGRARASSVEDHRRKPIVTRDPRTRGTQMSVIRTKPTETSRSTRATLDPLSDLLPPLSYLRRCYPL